MVGRKETFDLITGAGFDIGEWDEFNEKMENPESVEKLWNAVNGTNGINLGSIDEFQNSVKKKEETAQNNPSAEDFYGISDAPVEEPPKKQSALPGLGGEGFVQEENQLGEKWSNESSFLDQYLDVKEEEVQMPNCPFGMVWDDNQKKCVDADSWYENTTKEDPDYSKKRNKYWAANSEKYPGQLQEYRDKRDLALGKRKLRKTPFVNQEEGNDFRSWVVENYPEWAGVNNFTADGKEPINNLYARKAYEVFGKNYEFRLKPGEVLDDDGFRYRYYAGEFIPANVSDGGDDLLTRQEAYDYQLKLNGPHQINGVDTNMSELEWTDKQNPGSQLNIKEKLKYQPWDVVSERFNPSLKKSEEGQPELIAEETLEDDGFFSTSRPKPTTKFSVRENKYNKALQGMYNERHASDFDEKLAKAVGEENAFKIINSIDDSGAPVSLIEDELLKLSKSGNLTDSEKQIVEESEFYANWRNKNLVKINAHKNEQMNIANIAKTLQTKEGVSTLRDASVETGKDGGMTNMAKNLTTDSSYKTLVKDLYGKIESYDKAYSYLNDEISGYGSMYMSTDQKKKSLLYKQIEDAIEAGASPLEMMNLQREYEKVVGGTEEGLFNPFTGEAVSEEQLKDLPEFEQNYIREIQFKVDNQSKAIKKSIHFNPSGNMIKDLKDKRMNAYYTLVESARQVVSKYENKTQDQNVLSSMMGWDDGWKRLVDLAQSDKDFTMIPTHSGGVIDTKLSPLNYHSTQHKFAGHNIGEGTTTKEQQEIIEKFNESLSDFITLNQTLDLNLDPGTMERTGWFDRAVVKLMEEVGPEGFSVFDYADDFVESSAKQLKEMGYEITPKQEERLELRFMDKVGDAMGGSIPVMVEIMATSYLMGGFGVIGKAGKPGVVASKWKNVFGNSKTSKIFLEMFEQGLIFAPTSESFSTGAGEGLGFGLYDMSGVDKLIKKSKMGIAVNTVLKVLSGATAETAQEYSGEFISRLSEDENVGEAFKNTFISEDPLEKLAITYVMSTMFGVAGVRGSFKDVKKDMADQILASDSNSEIVMEAKRSIEKERELLNKEQKLELENTPDDALDEKQIKEKNKNLNDDINSKEEFVSNLSPEMKQEIGLGVNIEVQPNPDGGLFTHEPAFESTYEVNGTPVSEEEFVLKMQDPLFLEDLANTETKSSVKVQNGSEVANAAIEQAYSSMNELDPIISQVQDMVSNVPPMDVEGVEPGKEVITKEGAEETLDLAPKLSKNSKDNTPPDEKVRAVLDEVVVEANDLHEDIINGDATKEDEGLYDELQSIEEELAPNIEIHDTKTGEVLTVADLMDSDSYGQEINSVEKEQEVINALLDSDHETVWVEENIPFYGKTLLAPFKDNNGATLISAGTKVGRAEYVTIHDAWMVNEKAAYSDNLVFSSNPDLAINTTARNQANRGEGSTSQELVDKTEKFKEKLLNRKRKSGKTPAAKVAPFESTAEKALSKIESKKISSEDAASDWAKQIIKKGEKGTSEELIQLGVIEPNKNAYTNEYETVLDNIREHKKIPTNNVDVKGFVAPEFEGNFYGDAKAEWEDGLKILEQRRDELKQKLPKEKYVATEKFKKAVSTPSSNTISKKAVEKFLKDNEIIIEETATKSPPSPDPITRSDMQERVSVLVGDKPSEKGWIKNTTTVTVSDTKESGGKKLQTFNFDKKSAVQVQAALNSNSVIMIDKIKSGLLDVRALFLNHGEHLILDDQGLDMLLTHTESGETTEDAVKALTRLYEDHTQKNIRLLASREKEVTRAMDTDGVDPFILNSEILTEAYALQDAAKDALALANMIEIYALLGVKSKQDYKNLLKTIAANEFNLQRKRPKFYKKTDTRTEAEKGQTYGDHTIPGGINYNEHVLFTTPKVDVSSELVEESKLSSDDQTELDKTNRKIKNLIDSSQSLDEQLAEVTKEDIPNEVEKILLNPDVVDRMSKMGVLPSEYKAEVTKWRERQAIESHRGHNSVYSEINNFYENPLLLAGLFVQNQLNKESGKPYFVFKADQTSSSSPSLMEHAAEWKDHYVKKSGVEERIEQHTIVDEKGNPSKSFDTQEELIKFINAPENAAIQADFNLTWSDVSPNIISTIHANTLPDSGRRKWRKKYEAQLRIIDLQLQSNTKKRDDLNLKTQGAKKIINSKAKAPVSHGFNQENENILSWGRTKDIFKDIDGKKEKILQINEIQSDWAQAARKKGATKKAISELEHDALLEEQQTLLKRLADIKSSDKKMQKRRAELKDKNNGFNNYKTDVVLNKRGFEIEEENKGLRDRLYKIEQKLGDARGEVANMAHADTQSWVALQLRRLLKVAVDGGYDRISLPTGAQAGLAVGASGRAMKGNQVFYGNMVPNILKKEARRLDKKAGLETKNLYTSDRIVPGGDARHPSELSDAEIADAIKMRPTTIGARISASGIKKEAEFREYRGKLEDKLKLLDNAKNNKKKGVKNGEAVLVDANYGKADQQGLINKLQGKVDSAAADARRAELDARGSEINEQTTIKITPKMVEALSDTSPTQTKRLPKFSKGEKKSKPSLDEVIINRDAFQQQKTESGLLRSEQSEMGLQEVGQEAKDRGAVSLDSVKEPTVVTKNDSEQLDQLISEEKNPKRKKVLENVRKVNKALGKVDPNMKIVIHSSEGTYSSSYESAGGVKGDAEGTRGFFNNGQEIHINLNEATSETAFHEGAHKVIAAVLINNPELLRKFEKQLENILPASMVKAYKEKVSSYPKSEQTEEFIVNFLADVADGTVDLNKLPKTTLSKLVDIFNNLLKKFGFDHRFTVSNLQDVVEFADKMKNAFTEGVELDVTALTKDTAQKVKDIPSNLKLSKGDKGKNKSIRDKHNAAMKWVAEVEAGNKPKSELKLLTKSEIKYAKDRGILTDNEINELEKKIDEIANQEASDSDGKPFIKGRKARKFHERVSKSSWVPNKVKNLLEKSFYMPLSNDELTELAKGIVDSIEQEGINNGSQTELTIGDKFFTDINDMAKDKLIEESLLVAISLDMIDRLNSISTSTNSSEVASQEANIIDFISERGTKLGQAIQAFKLFGSTSNQGLMSYAKKQLVKKGEISEEQFEKERAEIERLIQRIKKAPDGFQKTNATVDFMSHISQVKGIKKGDIAMAVWYANILSGYTTQGVNFISTLINGMMNLASVLAIKPSLVANYVSHLFRGAINPTTGFRKGLIEFSSIISSGSKKGSDKFEMPNELENHKFKGLGKIFSGHKFVGRFMQATDALFYESFKEQRSYMLALATAKEKGLKGKALASEVANILYGTKDQQSKAREQAAEELGIVIENGKPQPITFASAQEQARKEGYGLTLEEAKTEARERGYEDGEGATDAEVKAFNSEVENIIKYRGEEALNKRAKKIKQRTTPVQFNRRVFEILEQSRPKDFADNAHNFAAKGTYNYKPVGRLGILAETIGDLTRKIPELRFIFPFTRIVANVTNEALEYTPYGFKRSMWGMIGEKQTQEARAQHFAKALAGTALMIGFASKAFDDDDDFDVTGSGPKDRKKYYDLLSTGWRPYSIKIGDTYVSYKFTPLNIGLGSIGTYRDRVRYEDSEEGALPLIFSVIFNSASNVMDQSFLSSGADLMEALGKGESAAKSLAKSIVRPAKSFIIPNMYTQIERIADSTVYESKSLVSWLMAQTPVAVHRNILNPVLNLFGEPVKRVTNPFLSIEATDNPEFKWLVDNKYWITTPSSNQWFIGRDDDNDLGTTAMDDEQLYEWVKTHGPKVKSYIRSWMDEDLSKLEQAGVDIHGEIKKGIQQIRKQEKVQMEWDESWGGNYKQINKDALEYLNKNGVYYLRPNRTREIYDEDGNKRVMSTEEYMEAWENSHTAKRKYVYEWFSNNFSKLPKYESEKGVEGYKYVDNAFKNIDRFYQEKVQNQKILKEEYVEVEDMSNKQYYYNDKPVGVEQYLFLNDVFLSYPQPSKQFEVYRDYWGDKRKDGTKTPEESRLNEDFYKRYLLKSQEGINITLYDYLPDAEDDAERFDESVKKTIKTDLRQEQSAVTKEFEDEVNQNNPEIWMKKVE